MKLAHREDRVQTGVRRVVKGMGNVLVTDPGSLKRPRHVEPKTRKPKGM